jgi:hypothetical protein
LLLALSGPALLLALSGPVLLLALALAFMPMASVAANEGGREIHGASDAFAAEGVAIAWAILRAANADDATVVMRVATDKARHPAVGVVAVEPFSGRSQSIRAPASVVGSVDVKSRRGRFGDFARTEVRLYASAKPGASDTPVLTIFYQGVPDTTPEFETDAKLRAWLDERITGLRAAPGGRKP